MEFNNVLSNSKETKNIMTEEPKSYTTDIDLWWNTVVSYNLSELMVERDEILEYVNHIIEYIDAFMLSPVIKYENHIVAAKSRGNSDGEDFNEVVEFFKDLKNNNEKVFLYMICIFSYKVKTQYSIRYATIEQV